MNNKYEFDPFFKENLCQNFRIARSIIDMDILDAAYFFDVTVDHLKRIEAIGDRSNISLSLLYRGTIVYNQDPNFFFKDWKENQKILNEILEERKKAKPSK